jgi:hypothetical protein
MLPGHQYFERVGIPAGTVSPATSAGRFPPRLPVPPRFTLAVS